MTKPCPSDEDLAAYVHDNVLPDERAYIEAHLAACSRCREIVVFVFHTTTAALRPDKPRKSTDS